MKKIFYSAVFCLALLGANAAQAAIIDFDSSAPLNYIPGPYQEDGFQLYNMFTGGESGRLWGETEVRRDADPDGYTYSSREGTPILFEKIDGGLFDFNSIDLADLSNSGTPASVGLSFLFADSSRIVRTFTLDSLIGLQTFTFNYTGVKRVNWWGGFQLDNIVVDSAVSQVPVPAAVWLFGSGLVGLLGFNRKRNQFAA